MGGFLKVILWCCKVFMLRTSFWKDRALEWLKEKWQYRMIRNRISKMFNVSLHFSGLFNVADSCEIYLPVVDVRVKVS